jgi:putative endonuclease
LIGWPLAPCHPVAGPAHLRTGKLGEEKAYFYLRRLGYTVVSRTFRSSRCRGEIDLIALG